jgi:peptidoglycan/xylan/chitin deacetylase (PgdA/CDA1 family)
MPGTVVFGIDVESAAEDAAGFARYAAELFSALDTPVTWYLTGKTLERYPEIFQEIERGGLIDLQAHTYNHLLLKTVLIQIPAGRVVHGSTGWFLQRGGTLPEIEEDLDRCQRVFADVLGRRATALTTPWGYYRGLGDRPDLLEIVYQQGFRVLRSFGRDARDGQPVPLAWQPFPYRVQGYPDLLEIMIHDYQDEFYWRAFAAPPDKASYVDHLKAVAQQVATGNLVWSLCSHDSGSGTREDFARTKGWFREVLHYAKGLGMQFLTATQYYQAVMAASLATEEPHVHHR